VKTRLRVSDLSNHKHGRKEEGEGGKGSFGNKLDKNVKYLAATQGGSAQMKQGENARFLSGKDGTYFKKSWLVACTREA